MEFAAHIREYDDKVQTVEEHNQNVAELSEEYAKSISMPATAYLMGKCHDLGKLTADFNGYICGKNKFRRGDLDHSFAGAKYIFELAEKFNIGHNKSVYEVSRFIARTIISHHGLHDWVREDGSSYFSDRLSNSERYNEISRNTEYLCGDTELYRLLKSAAEEYGKIRKTVQSLSPNAEIFAFYLGMLERFMQSVLIDADRTDTADFMSDCKTEKQFNTSHLWNTMSDRMNAKLESFGNKTDRISLQRKSISDRCARFANHKVGVCRLIVPTGGGKTLSSLRFAIDYCKNNDMDKIIYIAPFMSILEQNSDEICVIAGKENFLEHYSDFAQKLDDKEELAEYELRTEKWDSPVIATTMVQFFNTLFSGQSASVRRMHRLSRAVIIIDEVQSIPLKCVHLFNLAVNFLSHICGSAVVLCSATQPMFEKTDYPIILDEQSSMTGDYSRDFEVFKRTEIIPQLKKEGYTYSTAADFCYEKYLENGNLLAVVNTKESASEIYIAIKEKNDLSPDSEKANVVHLSTNMCPQHRRKAISEMRAMLSNGQKVICVTTQLIEAGVDISFNCVVRSLAGLDNAAQAAGRCNRNGEVSNACPVYIINISDERIDRLQQLTSARSSSERIIAGGQFPDLLSTDAMSLYFRMLYNERRTELSYPVKGIGTADDLVDLLSLNIHRNRDTLTTYAENKYCAQAFKTAGGLFRVIDENTEDIIVPYDDEAEQLLLRLDSDITPHETAELLRKAQKYTVSVYPNTKKKLDESGAIMPLKCGALRLQADFYDSSALGVCLKSRGKPLLLF